MRKITIFGTVCVVSALLGATAVQAHDFPANFNTAPKLAGTGYEVSSGQWMLLRHNAMHWREDIVTGYMRNNLMQREVGTLAVPRAVTIGGQSLAPGDYVVVLKNSRENMEGFLLEFRAAGDAPGKDIPLTPKQSQWVYDHLSMTLAPTGTEGTGTFDLHIAYGTLYAIVGGHINP